MTNRPAKGKKLELKSTVQPTYTKEQKDEFLKEYEAVVIPLFEKHKLCLVPIIQDFSNQYRIHQEAVFAVDVYKSPESKTEQSADSNN